MLRSRCSKKCKKSSVIRSSRCGEFSPGVTVRSWAILLNIVRSNGGLLSGAEP
ncbi:Uncharacterised protein [Vibrio cholerae]|nr:Uncharacterised protein [Vibrio cholerae]